MKKGLKNKIIIAVPIAILGLAGILALNLDFANENRGVAKTVQSDDFSGYNRGTEYTDGDKFGDWNVVFTGYGKARVVEGASGGNALELAPMAHSGPTDTSSIMLTGAAVGDTFTYRGKVSTKEQLRTGATPNAWETAWVVWNHTDNEHYYYFVARENGWELGKRDPKYTGGQRFMATGEKSWPLNSEKEFEILKTNNTVQIKINGEIITTIVDDENPYNSGNIGMYAEDSRIVMSEINVEDTANFDASNANHGGIAKIEGTPEVFEILNAKIEDADGIQSIVNYQWYANGVEVSSGYDSHATDNDGSKALTVRITYIDGKGNYESQISAPVQIRDDNASSNSVGSVAISGQPNVGETVIAQVRDQDGVPGRVQYTWLVDNQVVVGNTSSTLEILDSYLGKTIRVMAYYNDGAAHEENVTSDLFGPIAERLSPNPTTPSSIPAPTVGNNQIDNFEKYDSNLEFSAGETFADWELLYGKANIEESAGNKTLTLSSIQGQDSASLMLGKTIQSNDFTYSGTINSLTQLSATPQSWETEWTVLNYTDQAHFYYLSLREDGWTFAKRNGDVNNPQILATGTETFSKNQPKNFEITRENTRSFILRVNGKLLGMIGDVDGNHLTGGRIGLYTYNSAANIDNIAFIQGAGATTPNQPAQPIQPVQPTQPGNQSGANNGSQSGTAQSGGATTQAATTQANTNTGATAQANQVAVPSTGFEKQDSSPAGLIAIFAALSSITAFTIFKLKK